MFNSASPHTMISSGEEEEIFFSGTNFLMMLVMTTTSARNETKLAADVLALFY